MGKRLKEALILVVFFIECAGGDCLSSVVYTEGETLRPLAAAISENIVRIKLSDDRPDFDTEELSDGAMQRLAKTKSRGERIAIIMEARGKSISEVSDETDIPLKRLQGIVKNKGIPTVRLLYGISRALKVDPILIIDGIEWNKVKAKLKDYEKMLRLRPRKGKTQIEIVEELKKAGLKFKTDKADAQRSTYSNWERGKVKPLYGDGVIVAKVLGDDTLFNLQDEFKGNIELKVTPDMPIASKTGFGLAFYWKQIRGCSVNEAAERIGVTGDALRYLIKKYGEKKVAEFYGIDLKRETPKVRKQLKEKLIAQVIEPEVREEVKETVSAEEEKVTSEVEETDANYLPGVRRTKIHIFLAENRQVVRGQTIAQIVSKFGESHNITKEALGHFLRKNKDKDAAGFYEILWGKQPKEGPPRGGLMFLPGVRVFSATAMFFAKYGSKMRGMTPAEIYKKFGEAEGMTLTGINDFLRRHKQGWEVYGISKPSTGRPPGKTPSVRISPLPEKPPYRKITARERTKRLRAIWSKHLQLDTAEKFLEYLNRNEPELLKDLSEDRRICLLREFLFFGYEIVPLSEEVLEKLPDKKVGERIAAIREERGKNPNEVFKNAKIPQGTYYWIESSDSLPRPAHLFSISKELEIDPILIIEGRSWSKVAVGLKDKDNEKMYLCRIRKGWTREKLVRELEKAKFEFAAKTMSGKAHTIRQIEIGEKIPSPEMADVIGKILEEESLFEKVKKMKPAEPKRVKKTAEVKPRAAEVPLEDKKGWKYMEDVSPSTVHDFLAKNWRQIAGKTVSKITEMFPEKVIKRPSLISFLRKNPTAAEFYDIEEEEKEEKKIPLTEEQVKDLEADFAMGVAVDAYQALRSNKEEGGWPERWCVDGGDIEEAICLLEENLGYLSGRYKAISRKEFGRKQESDECAFAREQLKIARGLLPTLRSLVSTDSCDWDDMKIREKVAEITKDSTNDLEKARAFEKWVRENIEFALGYGAYYDAPASETLSSLKGDSFNRANLIVAMLRSVGIPCRYRILRFRKEMVKDITPADIYSKMDDEIEQVVAEALIGDRSQDSPEGKWISLAGEAFFNNKWMRLEEIEKKAIGESLYCFDIDSFAVRKAKKQSRKIRNQMEDYRRERMIQRIVNPLHQLQRHTAILQSA